jgi:TrpR family transcriptional regulator, trp operon repressor
MTSYHQSAEGWEDFLSLCAHIQSTKELTQVFDLFLTIEEKETIAARYLIIRALLEGTLTQREIAEECHVSIAQITRGSNALKIISPELRKLLKLHLNQSP